MSAFNQIAALIFLWFDRNTVPYDSMITGEYIRLHTNYIFLLPFDEIIRPA
jgi:hypothetical protein